MYKHFFLSDLNNLDNMSDTEYSEFYSKLKENSGKLFQFFEDEELVIFSEKNQSEIEKLFKFKICGDRPLNDYIDECMYDDGDSYEVTVTNSFFKHKILQQACINTLYSMIEDGEINLDTCYETGDIKQAIEDHMSDIAKKSLQDELDNLQCAMNALNSGKEQISFVRWNERNQ